MSNESTIYVDLVVRDSGAEAKIKSFGKQVETTSSSASKAAGGLGSSFTDLAKNIAAMSVAYIGVSGVVTGVVNEFKSGLQAVEDFGMTVAKSTALITTFSSQVAGGDLAGGFAAANAYAEQLALSMEMIDSKTIANSQNLQAMNETFIANGVLLDINNQKQVDGYTSIANALAIMTEGQNQDIQMRQEIRGLMDGQIVAADKLGQMLKAQVPDIVDQIEKWKEEGTVLENLGKLLEGFNSAAVLLKDQWATVGSTMETIHQKVLRGAFEPIFKDLIGLAQDLNSSLMDAEGHLTPLAESIQKDINEAYRDAKGLLADYGDELVKYAGYAAAAKLAQMAFNTAILSNPYVRAATALIALNEAMKDFQIPGMPAVDLSIDSLLGKYQDSVEHFGLAWDGLTGKIDSSGQAVSEYDQKLTKLEGLYAQLDQEMSGDKAWYSFKILEDPGQHDANVAKIRSDIAAVEADLSKSKNTTDAYNLSLEKQWGLGATVYAPQIEGSKGLTEAQEKAAKAAEKAAEKLKKQQEAADKLGVEYVSISQEIFLAAEAGVNFGTQLALLEKAKGIDVQSEQAKKAGEALDAAAAKAKDMGEAYRQIYDDMADSSSQFAEESLALSLKSLDAQVAGYKQAGVDEDTIRAWRAEQEKQLYQDWLTEHGSFVDGFKIGIQEMVEEIPTIGEMGKETFGILSDSWKDGFYAVITGDMDSLSDVWDSMLSSLLRQFSDFVASLILEWAAAEFLNINIGVNGTSLSSGSSTVLSGLSSLFSGSSDASTQSWSGSENASTYASGAASLGQEGSGMLATGAGYLGMGVGAYGVYSGVSNIAEGNYGTGALQTGLGGVSMYKGAVAADLLTEGTATEMAEAAWTGVKSYWSGSAGTAAGAEIGAQVGTQIAEGIHTAYTAGQGATSYSTFQASSSGASAGAGGAMAGLGAVGAFMAAVYALNSIGDVPQISSVDYMNQTGMSPEVLSQFEGSWTEVENTILDISEYSTNMGQALLTAGDNMLYWTSSMGIGAQQWDAAAQQWTSISLGAGLDAQQLGASAQAASILTVDAANSIISSYTGQNLTMVEAATVANSAAAAYQDLAASESGATQYSIQLQWELQAMGLSASDAAAAANELIAQMEAEAGASSTVADSASTATSSLFGFSTIITETATATASSISDLASSLGGFSSSVSETADSLRKAVGSYDDAVSSSGSRSAGVDGQFHDGGIIPYTGTYYMQGGERVIPKKEAQQSSGTTVVNVYLGNNQLTDFVAEVARSTTERSDNLTARRF